MGPLVHSSPARSPLERYSPARITVAEFGAVIGHDLDLLQRSTHRAALAPAQMVGCDQRRTLGRTIALIGLDVEHFVEEVECLGVGLGRADNQDLEVGADPIGEFGADLGDDDPP